MKSQQIAATDDYTSEQDLILLTIRNSIEDRFQNVNFKFISPISLNFGLVSFHCEPKNKEKYSSYIGEFTSNEKRIKLEIVFGYKKSKDKVKLCNYTLKFVSMNDYLEFLRKMNFRSLLQTVEGFNFIFSKLYFSNSTPTLNFNSNHFFTYSKLRENQLLFKDMLQNHSVQEYIDLLVLNHIYLQSNSNKNVLDIDIPYFSLSSPKISNFDEIKETLLKYQKNRDNYFSLLEMNKI